MYTKAKQCTADGEEVVKRHACSSMHMEVCILIITEAEAASEQWTADGGGRHACSSTHRR
jgi:hypothetical protein